MTAAGEKLDSPWSALAAATFLFAAFTLARLWANGFDATYFITAGAQFVSREEAPPGLAIREHSSGYDGQFYYRLALTPFTASARDRGITLDLPPHRHQRIVYPLLAWAVSLGRESWTPWALIAVNVLGAMILGGLAGKLAHLLGNHALWGLALALYPGFLLTLSRDLVEITMACFLLGALICWRRERHVWAAVLFSVAVLSRETALIAALVIAASEWLRGRRSFVYALPAGVYVLWQGVMAWTWGEAPIFANRGALGVPFLGLLSAGGENFRARGFHAAVWAGEIAVIGVFTRCVLASLRASKAPSAFRFAWGLYTLMALCMDRYLWLDGWNFLRALTEFYVFGVLIVMMAPPRARAAGFAGWAALGAYLAVVHSDIPRRLLP